MIHPSYSELMNVINSEVEEGEQPLSTEPLFNCKGCCYPCKADY